MTEMHRIGGDLYNNQVYRMKHVSKKTTDFDANIIPTHESVETLPPGLRDEQP